MKKLVAALAALACLTVSGCETTPADTTPPTAENTVFTVPYGQSGTLGEMIRANDDVDGEIAVTDSMLSGEYSFFAVGKYELTLTLSDSSANTASYPVSLVVESDLEPLSTQGDYSPAEIWDDLQGYWAGVEYSSYVYYIRFWEANDGRRATYGRFQKNGATTDARVLAVSISGNYIYLSIAPITDEAGGFAQTSQAVDMRIMHGIVGDGKMRCHFYDEGGNGNPEYNLVGGSWQDMLDEYAEIYPVE